MSRLSSLVDTGLVITDGAWGIEFQKLGQALGQPSDFWNLTRPEAALAVARSYVEAGSGVILTNTFRSNPVALAGQGEAEQAFELNRRGAEISREAAGRDVYVFASLGPTGKDLASGEIDAQTVTDAFRIQAEALAAGGADALLFETFSDVEEARLAVRAARPAGLPIIVSFAFVTGKNKDRTMMGLNPETAARAMALEGVDAVRGQLWRRARVVSLDLSPPQGGIGPACVDQAERGGANDRGRPSRLHHATRHVRWLSSRSRRGRGVVRRRVLRDKSGVRPGTRKGRGFMSVTRSERSQE